MTPPHPTLPTVPTDVPCGSLTQLAPAVAGNRHGHGLAAHGLVIPQSVGRLSPTII